jgi:outer membrane protein insertion porin family
MFRTLAVLLCLTVAASAQFKARSVVFTNAAPYPEQDLLTLAALKPGDSFTKPDLEAAAARLMATGYFDEVLPSLDGPFKAIEVRFKLKPLAPELLQPAGLENFVWFTPEELAAFRKSIPLLPFGIPEAGDQPQRVQAALQQMLAAKLIPGTVSFQPIPPHPGQPRRVLEFRVEPAHILLVVHLGGVTPDMVPAVKLALAQAQRAPFNEGIAGHTTDEILLSPYLDAGNLDAHLENESRTTASEPSAHIDLTATVIPGALYKVSALTFSPTPLLGAEAFAKIQKLHPGDPASRKLLLATLAPITSTYRNAAYLDVYVDATPVRDPATHTVAYTVTISPGEQYHLRSINMKGLPPDLRPDFDRTFPLKAGDLYNETAVLKYLVSHPEVKALAPYAGTFTAAADPATHQVDLAIQFITNGVNVH